MATMGRRVPHQMTTAFAQVATCSLTTLDAGSESLTFDDLHRSFGAAGSDMRPGSHYAGDFHIHVAAGEVHRNYLFDRIEHLHHQLHILDLSNCSASLLHVADIHLVTHYHTFHGRKLRHHAN